MHMIIIFQKFFHNAYNGMPSKPETLTSVFLMVRLYAFWPAVLGITILRTPLKNN